MRAFWLHLRNCPIRWAVPALVALDLAILFLRNRYWIGVWPDAGAAAQVPAYVIGPLVASAAAWSAAAPARHAVAEQLAAARVHAVVAEAYRLGVTVALLIAPYLFGQAVAVVLTARTAPPGVFLWAGYFAHGMFVTLLTICLGWILGKFFGSLFAALTSALACLLFLGVADKWFAFTVMSGHVEMAIDAAAVTVRLGLVLALLVILLWVPAASKQRTRTALAPVLGSLALLVAMSATDVTEYRQPPGTNVICLNARISLCVWPEHKKYVPALRKINSRIDTLPAVFVLPPLMKEYGIERTDIVVAGPHGLMVKQIKAGAPTFSILEGSVWSFSGDIATDIMNTTFDTAHSEKCKWDSWAGSDTARLEAVRSWLEGYLAGGGHPDYHTDSPSEMQAAMVLGHAMANNEPRTQQFSWAEREVHDLYGHYCTR